MFRQQNELQDHRVLSIPDVIGEVFDFRPRLVKALRDIIFHGLQKN
jgi:hypothetical protein